MASGVKRKVPFTIVETELLVSCRRRCCLCYYLRQDREEKRGQIAHINGDRSDSRLENLCWLCLEHHDVFDSRTSQSKNFTQAELRHYRDHLVQEMQAVPGGTSTNPHDILKAYRIRFRQAYAHHVAALIDFDCRVGDETLLASEICKRIARGQNSALVGPSGCGKSLVSYACALAAADDGAIPIIGRAKDFGGSLEHILDLETRSLLDCDSSEVFAACSKTATAVLVVIDGLNECAMTERDRLMNSIVTESSVKHSTIVLTCQELVENAEGLALQVVNVPPPLADLKQRIAEQSAMGNQLSGSVAALLEAIPSGVEARLVGEIGRHLPTSASRFAVFDLYARKRMGPSEIEGVRVLLSIAEALSDSIAFSVSIREADQLSGQIPLGSRGLGAALDSGLLVRRGDRVSFGHGLFLDAYAAEAVVRSSGHDPTQILAALRSPKHRPRRSLILGAIEDQTTLYAVLEKVEDSSLFTDCLTGACGHVAKSWTEHRVNTLLKRVHEEAASIECLANEDGFLEINPMSTRTWSSTELTLLATIADQIEQGELIEALLATLGVLDSRLQLERGRLRQELKSRGVKVRDTLFGDVYVLNPRLGLSWIVRGVASTFHRFNTATSPELSSYFDREDLSPGQLYFLLKLHGRRGTSADQWAGRLTGFLRTFWPKAPYHLQLELLDTVQYCDPGDDHVRRELIAAMEELPQPMHPFISRSWIDAMSGIGALDEDEANYVGVARHELRQCLLDPNSEDARSRCFGIWTFQIDHPYSRAYNQAVSELLPKDKGNFLSMAALGAEDEAFFVGSLLEEIRRLEDSSFANAVQRWTRLPSRDTSMHQDAVHAFARAHVTLGWLSCPLPVVAVEGDADTARAMIACGEVLYWANRRDLDENQRTDACSNALAVLMAHELGVSANAIWLIRNSGLPRSGVEGQLQPMTCIVEAFPDQAVEVYRESLRRPEIQRGYFPRIGDWDRNGRMQFAMQVLGTFGNVNDLPLLKMYTEHVVWGDAAVRAIHRIRERA